MSNAIDHCESCTTRVMCHMERRCVASAPVPCSAWELRRKMAALHGRKLTEELYQWFTHLKHTLSYETAGIHLLLGLPEGEAIQVLANAHRKIQGDGILWSDFVKQNADVEARRK